MKEAVVLKVRNDKNFLSGFFFNKDYLNGDQGLEKVRIARSKIPIKQYHTQAVLRIRAGSAFHFYTGRIRIRLFPLLLIRIRIRIFLHFDADLDPVPQQSDANLHPLNY